MIMIRFSKVLPAIVIRNNILTFSRRYFLSDAFECKDVWNSRLSLPIFQKIESEAMYYELDGIFKRRNRANAIDIDIFVNVQKDDSFITEVEELVHKLRLSAETGNTLPTTHHAFIRLFTECNKKEDLMRILDDRLNYGIFPDIYCSLYLLNRFLKEKDYKNAAKVAALRMLQEDFSNELVKYLSVYSILNYLPTNEPWRIEPVETKPTNDDEDEEEVIKVKVPVLRNPFFDDHFDLTDGQHICGKTLVMIASTISNDLTNSLKMMGLALYNKWDKLEDHLNVLVKEGDVLFSESLKSTEDIVKSKLEDAERSNKILNILKQLESKNCISESITDRVSEMIKNEVASSEKELIESQGKLYKDWEILREVKLQEFLDEMNKRKRLEDVRRKKEELQLKEELLYFFDREDEIDLVIEKKEDLIRRRTFPDSVKDQEEDYVPPEVHKRDTK